MRQIVLIAALILSHQASADARSTDFSDPWQVYAHELLRDSVAFKSVRGEKQVVPFFEFLAQKFVNAGAGRISEDFKPIATFLPFA